jgi:isopenicillin N synthase-like dioxygenase
MGRLREVPVVDLTPFRVGSADDRARVARAVDDALTQLGFLAVIGHGASTEVLTQAALTAHRFFDLPAAEKMTVANVQRGYAPCGTTALSYLAGRPSPPDLKESFGVGPERRGENLWPTRSAEFRSDLVASYEALEGVTSHMLHVFAAALDLPLDFFDAKFEAHNNSMRIFHYPPQEIAPLPGQMRAGEHTDFTALTILMVEEQGPSGLQVQLKDGNWIDIHLPREALVVNVGDLMMHWTNDRWFSSVHRVVNPPAGAANGPGRQSFVFFANPREDETIECIESCYGPDRPAKYAPIRSGEFQERKLKQFRRSVAEAQARIGFESQ